MRWENLCSYWTGISVQIRRNTHLPAVTEEEALLTLDQFSERWNEKYPQISRPWRTHWNNLNTLLNYPEDIRKAIYTTNAIESINSIIRKAIKKRKLFSAEYYNRYWHSVNPTQ